MSEKRGRGRPPLDPEGSKELRVKLGANHHAAVIAAAQEQGMTLSEYVRHVTAEALDSSAA